MSVEVGYVLGENGYHALENVSISQYNASDIVTFTTASGSGGTGTVYKSERLIGDLQKIFDQRVQVNNPIVHDEATGLATKYPGEHTIGQVCDIHSYLTKNWRYTGDPRGEDYYKYANETLQLGRENNCAGAGDCDDFAILMSAMIESIGGTTRIVLAKSSQSNHVYAEVYLGKIDLNGIGSDDENVNRIVTWLKHKYDVRRIYATVDVDTGNVWLNLDWGSNKYSASHPGGQFFQANTYMPVYIRDVYDKTPLNPSPMALFVHPSESNAGEPVTFDASQSGEADEIINYEWDFGDNTIDKGTSVNHTYSKGGSFPVILNITDSQGATSSKTSIVRINNPPIADFTYSPENPKAGDTVTFNSSPSNDSDGKILKYEWDFGGEYSSNLKQPEQRYKTSGRFAVNLTVTDEKDSVGFKSTIIKINAPPIAHFTYEPEEPNAGQEVTFDASSSKDIDGNVTGHTWDFGDISSSKDEKPVHVYSEGGKYKVRLTTVDDGGATGNYSSEVKINHLPLAIIDYSPKEPTTSEAITFNASQSKDPDGKIVSWVWKFGDGSAGEGISADHAYLRSIEFTLNLTVTDNHGASNSSYANVTVMPAKGDLLEMRSVVTDLATSDFTWTPISFAGFYYDVDKKIGTESLTLHLSDVTPSSAVLREYSDESGNSGVVYETMAQAMDFKFQEWGRYDVIGFLGEKYFVAYDAVQTQAMQAKNLIVPSLYEKSEKTNLMINKQICKVLRDSDAEMTLTSASPLKLAEGYELALNSMDINGEKVSLELTKNGEVVDSRVVSPSANSATMEDRTYYFKKDLGLTKGIVIIAVHFRSSFRGADRNFATIDGVFQISETPESIKEDQKYDNMSIRTVDATNGFIKMDNEDNQIILMKDTDILLMGRIHIKTAKQDIIDEANPLIYYISKLSR
ncbi:MAG: PKD domain-containing protein [Methanothrix sp.]|nr:PKD domain-containing protein [Methanothrix sp.]